MSLAFVDTTVLTDLLLKRDSSHQKARVAVGNYKRTLLPVYAIKEMKDGPLATFAWFHNKLKSTGSLERSIEALQRMTRTPKRHFVATGLQALQEAQGIVGGESIRELVEKYGESAKLDSVQCDRFRLALKRRIFSAWRHRRNEVSEVVLSVPCYTERAPFERRGLLDLRPRKCQPLRECALADSLKAYPSKLRRMMEAIESQPDKPENRRRRRVLRQLVRKRKQPMTEKDCRDLGDAVFAFFAPDESVVLTTNVKDFEPLCGALGKKVEAP